MDRLTTRSSLCDGCPKEDWCHQDCFESQLYERLAHYEDLEEQGRLVEQKHGKWEECDWVFCDGHDECVHIPKGAFVCTNCRHAFKKEKLEIRNYCPHCGAKMAATEAKLAEKGGGSDE